MMKEWQISGNTISQEDLEITYPTCILGRPYIVMEADWRVITGTDLINTGERST